MQAKCIYICICTYDGIKVGLLYNNAGCVVKSVESDSHSASYTSFMMDTISATMYLYTPMATGQVVDSQWLYLVVGHLC